MVSIRMAIDNIQGKSADSKTLESVAQKLRAAGHSVTTHGVGPNQIQGVMRKSSNKCDLMIQIAGGRCIGTLCDFYLGINSGYYHAKQGAFLYFKKSFDYTVHRAGDDDFSIHPGTAIYKEVNKWIGKKLADVYNAYKGKVYYGVGNTADELAKTFLANYGQSTTSSTETSSGGRTALDVIKEICTPWNPYGIAATIMGDTLQLKRTNPNIATPLTEKMIVNNSVSFTDYDNSTPNSYRGYEDSFLINKFGNIPLDESVVDSTWKDQVLLMAQRGHEHSIDMKVISSPLFVEDRWVSLTLPRYNMYNRPYYISKCTHSEERILGLTLEPGPPEFYAEVEETVDESSVDDETVEDE